MSFEIVVRLSEVRPMLRELVMLSMSKPILEKQVKIVFLGDDRVGKTSIVRRFVDDEFKPQYRPTLGVQVFTKDHYVFPPESGQELLIYFWDIGAQKYYEIVRPDYYVGMSAVIFVADVMKVESIQNLRYWHEEIRSHVRYPCGWMVALNKVDLVNGDEENLRTKAMNELPVDLQDQNRVVFTSAKENRSIEELIHGALRQVVGPSVSSVGKKDESGETLLRQDEGKKRTKKRSKKKKRSS